MGTRQLTIVVIKASPDRQVGDRIRELARVFVNRVGLECESLSDLDYGRWHASNDRRPICG